MSSESLDMSSTVVTDIPSCSTKKVVSMPQLSLLSVNIRPQTLLFHSYDHQDFQDHIIVLNLTIWFSATFVLSIFTMKTMEDPYANMIWLRRLPESANKLLGVRTFMLLMEGPRDMYRDFTKTSFSAPVALDSSTTFESLVSFQPAGTTKRFLKTQEVKIPESHY